MSNLDMFESWLAKNDNNEISKRELAKRAYFYGEYWLRVLSVIIGTSFIFILIGFLLGLNSARL